MMAESTRSIVDIFSLPPEIFNSIISLLPLGGIYSLCLTSRSLYNLLIPLLNSSSLSLKQELLDWSCIRNSITCLRRAHAAGASFCRSMRHLHMAASAGSTVIVKFLIKELRFRPMVIQVGEYRGLTPLELAAKYDHVDIAEYLIDHGAENSVKICRYRLTKKPLQIALKNGSLNVLRLLRRMDLLEKSIWYPAFTKALVSAKPLSLLPFLEMGLHNGLGNEITKTPLQSVVKWGLVEPVRLMLEYGANVNEKGKFGDTALQESCKWPERHAITAMLLEAGADVSVRTSYGQTPLQMAMCRGDVELVRMLLVRARPKMQIMCWTPVRARKDRGRMTGRKKCKNLG